MKQIERHGKTFKGKITEDQANHIRTLYRSGNYTQQEIADLYEVNIKTVRLHLNKKGPRPHAQ